MNSLFSCRHRLSLAAACLSLSLIGCGSDEVERPDTFPVTGMVTFNGQPLSGAFVRFDGAGTNKGAYGTTDAEGRYTLTTFKPRDGARPGNHRVSVMHEVSDGEDINAADALKMGGQIVEPPKTISTLPERYGSFDTSGLTAEVSDEENTVDLPLTP